MKNHTPYYENKNYKLIAALYLLTADTKMWDTAKGSAGKDDIVFENIHLKSGSETAYTLYCAAKDLYNGSRHALRVGIFSH